MPAQITQDCLTLHDINVTQVLTHQGNTSNSSMQLAQSTMNATVVVSNEALTNKRSRIQEEGVSVPSLKRQRIRRVRWAEKPQFVEADPDANVGINHAEIWYTVIHVICFQFFCVFLYFIAHSSLSF
jgi:hypothetical protein